MSEDRIFVDTNVLVYAVSSDPGEAFKKERALALIEGVDFGLSAQVMQEFYVVVTRKIARPCALTPTVAGGAYTKRRFALARSWLTISTRSAAPT